MKSPKKKHLYFRTEKKTSKLRIPSMIMIFKK